MATRQETANAVYRDYEVDGVPTSGAHEPVKAEIRAYESLQNAAIDALLDATALTDVLPFETRALLFADLAHAAGVWAVVFADATAAYNGMYLKSGASGTGSWTKKADIFSGSASQSALTSESNTRAAADTSLQANIDAETAARVAADALKAPLVSPALAGAPTAPTAPEGTNTTQIANTAFVTTAVAAEASARIAADALKAPLVSPALAGTPTAPTAPEGTNTTQIANTAFVANVDSKYSRLETARGPGIFLPGQSPAYFTASTVGSPESTTALTAESVVNTADGRAYRITGAGRLNVRAVAWLRGDRKFKCRVIYRRSADVTDPNNDAISIVVFWLSYTFALVSEQAIITDSTATAAAGKQVKEFDLPTAPAGAVYARLGVRTYGGDGSTDVYEEAIEDITNLDDVIPSPTVYQGAWDASANDPQIQSGVGTQGHFYKVSVAGTTAIDGVSTWNIDDTIIFNGTAWERIPTGVENASVITADNPSSNRATNRPYRWTLHDDDGDVVLGVSPDGRVALAGVDVAPTPRARNTASPFVDVVSSASGALIRADRRDGSLALSLHKQAGAFFDPSIMRGAHRHFNVRPDGARGIAATAQDGDGYVDDIYQRRDIITDAAVAVGSRSLEIYGCIGQSNAGSGSGPSGGPTWTDHRFSHHLLMAEGSPSVYGNLEVSTLGFRPPYDFAAYAQPAGYGQDPLGMALEALVQFERDAGVRNPARVGQVSWEGGQPLGNFFPGTASHWNHENMVYRLGQIKSFADKYPFDSVSLPAIVLIQGEAGPYPYATTLESWIDDVLPLYKTPVAQSSTPKLLFMQINTGTSSGSNSGVELDQLAVARSRWPAVSLVGPMYQYPFWLPTSSNGIHLSDLGRMMMGENIAIAIDRVVRRGLSWNPLWPLAGGVTRVNNVITIPMIGTAEASPLKFDDDWVQGVTNRGFVFSQTGGNSPVIQSVEISGSNVVVTLDVTPTGSSKKISYALANDTGTDGWATGRGQLYVSDQRTSVFYRRGFAVPSKVRHYCVRFQENVP
jgi:hypothetical protein